MKNKLLYKIKNSIIRCGFTDFLDSGKLLYICERMRMKKKNDNAFLDLTFLSFSSLKLKSPVVSGLHGFRGKVGCNFCPCFWKSFGNCTSIALWQLSFASLRSFALCMCKLVFGWRQKRGLLCWFLELFFLLVALFSLPWPQDFSHFRFPYLTSQLCEAAVLHSLWLSAQWSGKGPQAEEEGNYKTTY